MNCKSFLVLVIAGSGVFCGCEEKSPSSTTSTVPGSKTASDMATEAKNKVVSTIQSGLDTAKTQIDSLAAKVSGASEDQKPALQSTVDDLRAKYDAVVSKLSSLKSENGASWRQAASDVQSAFDSLKESLTSAMSKFK